MNIQEIRRLRLAQLIAERYRGSQAAFIAETGENQGEVSALLKTKSFGERKARKIEVKCDLPAGWLDVDAGSEGTPLVRLVETRSLPDKTKEFAKEVAALITMYGQATETSRVAILRFAKNAEKTTSSSGLESYND